MNKYNNAKIYRLVCNITGLNYYGSTTQSLSQRKSGHKVDYKKGSGLTSSKIIEGGNYDIILVEEFSCDNKNQLEARERYFIENNDCVNKMIPTRTHKEYLEANKEAISKKSKEYKTNNKIKIKEQTIKYIEANKEAIAKQKKEFYEANKEAITKYKKEYREANKDKLNELRRQKYKENKK